MIKKVDCGITPLSRLHEVFRLSEEDLYNKRARLFPKSTKTNLEIPTTSIFLASLAIVKEYRELLLIEIGIKRIKNHNVNLHVYTEISNKSRSYIIDGVIVVTSGKNTPIVEWIAFIDCKVGSVEIKREKIDRYIDFAREIGVNDLISISNEFVTKSTDSPVKSQKHKFNLFHWSWTYLKVIALKLVVNKQVEDINHIYILTELRRYFDTHLNIKNYRDMGTTWKNATVKVLQCSSSQKINEKTLATLSDSYLQKEKDISLQLTDCTKYYVTLITDDGPRSGALAVMLQKERKFKSIFSIDKNKNKRFYIEIDFLRRSLLCYMKYVIPAGKAKAQTSKLLDQLIISKATDEITIDPHFKHKRQTKKNISVKQLSKEKINRDQYTILEKEDLDREIAYFTIGMEDSTAAGFSSSTKFVTKLEAITELFMTQVVARMYR